MKMAIGNGYSYNSRGNGDNSGSAQNKLFEATYYSRLRFKNPETKMSISPSFRSGNLVLEISEILDNFKYDSKIAINISPTKARLFADKLKQFKDEIVNGTYTDGKGYGITSGMREKVTYIAAHSENGSMIITIGEIDGNGNIIKSFDYNINKDYHYSIQWNNVRNMDIVKDIDNFIELNQLIDLVEDFGRVMSGAIGYSAADINRYESARVLRKMDPIYDKLGIERISNGGNYGGASNNFLNNAKTESNHTSFESIENGYFDEE
jgi:hypothetical protein